MNTPLRGPAWDSWLLCLGVFNLWFGVRDAIAGAAHGKPWAGAVSLFLGVLLIWMWWHDHGDGIRKRARKLLGTKSAALRAALARRLAGAPA